MAVLIEGMRPAASGLAGADAALSQRLRSEFEEMPGLRLTLPQAARLFSLEAWRCERILGELVSSGYLKYDRRGFASARDGRSA